MKNFLSVLSSTLQGGLRGGLLTLALLATSTLWAYDFQSGDLYYNITSDTVPYTVEVTYQYEGSNLNYSGLTTVEFPASVIYDGITYDVTSIGEKAFKNHSTLISVTIGNNVTSIGKNAFSYIYSLDSVIIGNSVTSIGVGAFQYCHALSSVTIGNSVTSIGGSAFHYCKSLTSITIPNSVTSIGADAFAWCYELSSISIGDSVTSIGSEAFESTKVYQNKSYWENGKVLYIDNYLIKAIGISGDYTIRDSTRVIANDAFSECSSLTSITIPNSVISIGSYAFYKCPALSSITMSENITRIENYTFSYCSALTSVTIPENVMSIGNYSFSDCSALTSITIPENVTSIGEYAFSDCSALTSITIPKNVTHIGTNAFAGCSDITSIVWEAICCGGNPFYSLRSQITSFTFGDNVECIPGQLCNEMDKLESIVIPNSVTSIGWRAFYGCSSLTSVTIGASVTSINYDSFFSCPSLTSVVWNATNYTGRAGDVFNDNLASQITSFTFGDSVEYIPASLCYNMDNITDINIPNSVDSIGVAAFQSCDALSSVTIGNSVTSIGDDAFYECSSLTSVSIGNSVTNIGGSAFGYCSSLTSITIPNSVTSIGDWAFSSCSSLTSITIPNSVTSIGDDAFYGCSSISSITLAAPTIEVFCQGQTNQLLKDNYYLQVDRKIQINGNNVTNIVIPESVDSIKSYAFYMCQISSVEIGDAVTGIGKGAFYSCSSLTSATIGDGVTNISVSAFSDCSSLTSVSIGNSVTSIEGSAFRNCSSLTSIIIPNSVTSIEGGAFRNCSSLTSITIPNSVTSIGEEAFTDCSSLTSVVWNATNYENITETSISPFHCVLSQITSFTFGDSVKSIPAYLCRGMTNLQSIVIPNSVDSVKYYAFNGCSSLKSVRIGEGLKYIDRRAFYECTAIESVEWNAINCNVKFYENDRNPMLFYYSREQISSFAFGDNVEFIPQQLCYGMDKLKSIVIPNSVTNIGKSAFLDCSSLTSIVIGNSVTSIGNYAFNGCSSLTSITIPESVTSIGEDAFGGSTGFLLVTLKIKSIEDYMQRKVNDQLYEASLILPKRILSINDAYEITDIIVPENIDSISDYAFYNCYHIRSISLHDNNKYLGEYALSGCTSLTSIQLPYNIEGLTKTSLSNCYSIQSITITAPSIEEYCQSYINSNLYDYGFAESAKRNIVINGQAVTDLVIPEPVTTIGELVFYNCTTLTSLTLPKHVESIEWSAFYGCEALESIYQKSMTPPVVQPYALSSYPVCYVPYGSLSAYENSAWAEQVSHFVEEPLRGYKIYYTTSNGQIINPSISDPFDATIMSNVYENGQGVITFEGPVSTIKAGAFSNCSNLTSITIPVSIKQIENQAFANCSALGVVDVKCITPPVLGNEVFTSAPTCYIPCGTKHLFENSAWSEQVGEFIAEECGGNKIFYTTIDGDIITPSETVDFGAKMISNVYEFGQGIMTFDGPVTHMAGFSNCKTLTSITIPESVTTVEGSCFGNCSLLTSIVWNAKHVEQVKWGGGSWLGAPLPAYDMFEGVRSQITSFVFGESVEYIPDYLCYYMENLREIIIPESVQGISKYAFSRCSALTSAVIGNNVKTIGEHAFSYCSSLTSATIGKSVITIGEEAFRDCSALTSIVIPDSVLAIENSTFFNCSALTSVTLNNSLISIYDYAFMDCSSLTSITIPENVTYIGGRVFYDCSALTSVTWNAMDCGDFVDYYSDGRKVPSSRFEGCPITSFTFGDNVEYIPGGLCYQMTGLQSIVLPENVYSIGDYAFYGCSSLTSITIPEHVYSMGERAFYGCSSLASITIPENVSSIGGYAFSYCSSLKTVAWNAINPEEIIIEQGSSIVSPFSNSPIESLIIGDRVTYIPKKLCDNCSTLTSVTIGKKVKEIGADAFYGCSALAQTNYTGDIAGWCQIALGSFSSNPTYNSKNLFINGEEVKDVVIPNTVTSISSCAFYNCEKISSLTISESVKSIGYNAFGGCKKLFDIYCYPTTPPEAQENSFTNYNVNLYVPCESLKDYQMDMVFGSFKYIQCLEDTPPSEPQDTTIYHPTVYDVICEGETYIWMGMPYTEAGTYTYEEIVEDKNYIYHNIYTLELTVIPPEIVVLPEEEAYDSYEWHGEVYTESGTYFYEDYCYQEILHLTIIPSPGTAVDNMQTDSDHSAQKILRDQQILILRDGKTYTIMGAEVK